MSITHFPERSQTKSVLLHKRHNSIMEHYKKDSIGELSSYYTNDNGPYLSQFKGVAL